MPVGTVASVKGASRELKEDINPDIILGNTYHFIFASANSNPRESRWFT
jgi:queuine/archaeosine tRNA-ribosyltransferase